MNQLKKFSINKIYQILLIVLAFLAPLTVSGGNIVIGIIVIIWLLSGHYKSKFIQIINNKLMVSSLIFFGTHVIGLLWTEDLMWGLHMVKKMWYFFLFWPILYTIVQKKYVKFYIYAFLLAMGITEVLSYAIWFEIIPPFKNAIVDDPTPFMSHISYNPLLTIAIYLVAHNLLFNKKIQDYKWYLYSFFLVTMSINMFITGGRAGQVMYFFMISILAIQYFKNSLMKALFFIIIVVPLIFTSAYQSNGHFKNRVDLAYENIVYYGDDAFKSKSINKQSSVGQRITYTINSIEIIKNHPIAGVGTGDFVTEYREMNQKNSPEVADTTNPHNMYILILVQLGLIGLVSMLSIFYYQFKFAIRNSNIFYRHLGITLPLLYLIIMFSDSYLLGHYTTLIFVFFSAFLYKDFEKN